MQPTQKEASLLKDLKGQEKLCVDKYTKHADAAIDGQLKNLFSQIAQVEQSHYEMIEQLENGTMPQMGSGSNSMPQFDSTYSQTENEDKKHDAFLCNDLLTMEKHASHLYDTCIFEFKEENTRNLLNQIQKQEQTHGKMIYDYMSKNNMYS